MEAAKNYLEKGSIDVNNENGVIVINKNIILNQKTKKNYKGKVLDIKPGDEIDLKYINNEKGIGSTKKAKVTAVLNDDPFEPDLACKGVKLITTEKVLKNLTGANSIKPVALNIELKDVKSEEEAKTQIQNVVASNPNLQVINYIDMNREVGSASLMVKILIYGFVIVVSLIGSVNIVNTLTTNIILRKREFAALKAIGFTQKGLKKMIVLEGILYGVVGTVYGSVISCGLSYLMYKGMSGIQESQWSIPWTAIGIAGLAAIIIGYLSVLSPLARINRENIIETIREDS
ncbi:FtsX-like permease family protein [Clostridium sp. DMHC 10]|nr:FtsX-like permease family protein [Clostridium sp. DMHC 10]